MKLYRTHVFAALCNVDTVGLRLRLSNYSIFFDGSKPFPVRIEFQSSFVRHLIQTAAEEARPVSSALLIARYEFRRIHRSYVRPNTLHGRQEFDFRVAEFRPQKFRSRFSLHQRAEHTLTQFSEIRAKMPFKFSSTNRSASAPASMVRGHRKQHDHAQCHWRRQRAPSAAYTLHYEHVVRLLFIPLPSSAQS